MKQRYIQAIWEVTETLQTEKQMERGLSVSLNVLSDIVEAEAGLVWLINPHDGRLHSVACSGQKDLTGVSIDPANSLAGRCFRTREVVQIDDTVNSQDFCAAEDPDLDLKITNTLFIPLATKTGSFGCLQLINKAGSGYTESERALGVNLAALLALDLEDKGYEVHYRKQKNPLIEMKDIRKDFISGEEVLHVLKGIDLTIYEQEFLVILGESGCGKTTLLNILGGMDSMTDGTMTVEGRDFSRPGEKELTEYRRDYIGFVFQTYNLMPNLSAIDNVELIAENSKHPLSSEKAIEMVGLSERRYNRPSQLSGGQQQRVSIARALVKNPLLILADEPTAALDFQTGHEVLELFEDIVRNQNRTVVMVTHNAEIAKMADRVVRVRGGQISSIRINSAPLKASELTW